MMTNEVIWYSEVHNFLDAPPELLVIVEGRISDIKLGIYVSMITSDISGAEVEYFSKVVDLDHTRNPDILNDMYITEIANVKSSLGSDWVRWLASFQKKLQGQVESPVYFDFPSLQWFFVASKETSAQSPSL